MVTPATPPAIIQRADDFTPIKEWQKAAARKIFAFQKPVSEKYGIPEEAGLVIVEHECKFDFTACNKNTGASGPYQIVSPMSWNLPNRLATYDPAKSTIGVYKMWTIWWNRDILPTVGHLARAEMIAVLFLFHNQGGGFGRSAIAKAKAKNPKPSLQEIVLAKRFAGGNRPNGIIEVANRVAYMRQLISSFGAGV